MSLSAAVDTVGEVEHRAYSASAAIRSAAEASRAGYEYSQWSSGSEQ
jgi:hypothetical protein